MNIDELIELRAREVAIDVFKTMQSKNGSVGVLPRMRTVDNAVKEMKQADPGTEVTSGLIKELVAQGKIAYQCVGNKKLINLDALMQYLATSSSGDYTPTAKEDMRGIIRAVKE